MCKLFVVGVDCSHDRSIILSDDFILVDELGGEKSHSRSREIGSFNV